MKGEENIRIPNPNIKYPRENDESIIYLKNFINNTNIIIGDYTYYHDFENPENFQDKNVLYHYWCNNDKLIIGKFCSIANGAKFIFNGANHNMKSFSTYPFPVFKEEWGMDVDITESWNNKGDIVIGNDVWIGYESVIMSGVTIGDGAIIGTRALVTKDVPPYSIVGGVPAKIIRKRFSDDIIGELLHIKWWDLDIEKMKDNLDAIRSGDVIKLKDNL